jgi:hypothetical protein
MEIRNHWATNVPVYGTTPVLASGARPDVGLWCPLQQDKRGTETDVGVVSAWRLLVPCSSVAITIAISEIRNLKRGVQQK